MWPGVEPARNQYNTTYLGIFYKFYYYFYMNIKFNLNKIELVEQVIANMSAHGIYALIDCHQDVLSEKFCGEGNYDFVIYYINLN